jgi:hypothetical protein
MSERVRHPREVLIMFSISHSRSFVVAGALAAGVLVAAAPSAGAVPAPEPVTVTVSACPVGMEGLAGRLGSAGLSAQAAHVATELTYRDCLRDVSVG